MAAADTGAGIGGFHGVPGKVKEVYGKLTNRTRDPIPEMVQKLADEKPVYLFSVSPWINKRRLGTIGLKIILPCLEGKEYGEALVIPGLVFQPYPQSETSDKIVTEEGLKIATEILGLGAHNSPSNSLVPRGVGICHQWPPTKQEIAAARKAFHEGELAKLIREADTATAQGPKASEDTIRARHHEAAAILKLSAADHPWMGRTQAAAEREECKFCGEPMRKGLPKCPNCKEVVNQAEYDKLKGVQKAEK